LDGTAAFHGRRQRVGCRLPDHGAFQIGDLLQQGVGLEGRHREKVEINRWAVSQAQGDGRAAIEGEVVGSLRQLGPEAFLGSRQDVESRPEDIRHIAILADFQRDRELATNYRFPLSRAKDRSGGMTIRESRARRERRSRTSDRCPTADHAATVFLRSTGVARPIGCRCRRADPCPSVWGSIVCHRRPCP